MRRERELQQKDKRRIRNLLLQLNFNKTNLRRSLIRNCWQVSWDLKGQNLVVSKSKFIQATQLSKDLGPKVNCWRFMKKRKVSFYYSLMILMINIKPWIRGLRAKFSLLMMSSLSLTIKDLLRETICRLKMVSKTHTLENEPTHFF